MTKVLNCGLLVSEFELQFHYCIYVWTNTPWERYASPYSPSGNQYLVKHILIECTKLNHTRKKFYKANSIKELFFKNCSQKHNQLLKNNWPPTKDIDYVTNTFDNQVYTNKKLWHSYIHTHTYISEFNIQWPLRGQFAIKPNHHQPKHLHLQIIYILYV